MIRVYIALGSNQGNRHQHILQSATDIDQLEGCRLLNLSSVYETDPMGPQDQPDYLNAVCAIHCSLEPHSLLEALQSIESSHGREKQGRRWGARPLDLDILLYGERTVYSADLQIPHQGIARRSFVLWPLAEIDPMLHIPGFGPVSGLKPWCEDLGIRQYGSAEA